MKKLESEEDAFGHALLAVHKGEEVHEIVERNDGFVDSMSTKGYFSDYEAWSPIEQKAMQLVKGRVLDIGSGAGRTSLYLQEKGFLCAWNRYFSSCQSLQTKRVAQIKAYANRNYRLQTKLF